ncbi:DUF5808 domain-containing protein [Mucilaginibacter sp. RCC_168]|jgi:uncharacterized membrane protein|uniref:DUF5808 domain-containing protein n=1 Tax=Mucilaginibacter sp. RCC_168 TaxID=3239221 RepID=UPI003525B55A
MEPIEDGSNYKYGVFYFNKNDPRTIVPKRIRFMGWTLNFARPASYVIMAAIVGLVVWAIVFKK